MTKSRIQLIIIVVLVLFFAGLILFFSVEDKDTMPVDNQKYENIYDKKIEVISDKNADGSYNLDFNNSKWRYDKEHDVYYQIGIVYCLHPESIDYQCLSIYVPGKYLNGVENEDGTYTCVKSNEAQVGIYNVNSAPIIMPINSDGYTVQKSTVFYNYDGLKEYIDAGFIYVYPGFRGMNENGSKVEGTAPWGVTDLKAAIRYLRYNADSIVGNTNKIFMLGHGDGGGLATIVGTSGDNTLYLPYLKKVGAALADKGGKTISDKLDGVVSWCSSMISEMSNASYEWNIGQYVGTNTREKTVFTKSLSNDLSIEFVKYINDLNLRDENRNLLQLSESESNIFANGTYYNYVKLVLENSLNNFIHDTTFPTTIEIITQDDGNFPGGNRRGAGVATKKTQHHNSIKEYIDSLNKAKKWIAYDENNNSAIITSVEDYVINCKKVNKDVGAFDNFTKNQVENKLFATPNTKSVHYDSTMSSLLNTKTADYSKLKKWSKLYPTEYSKDLLEVDSLNYNVETRVKMYNPMFYLTTQGNENNFSNVAKYWRINTGINQSNIANVNEINLYLLLKSDKDVAKVDYTTVWGQEHSMAERKGNAVQNAIEWINSCN